MALERRDDPNNSKKGNKSKNTPFKKDKKKGFDVGDDDAYPNMSDDLYFSAPPRGSLLDPNNNQFASTREVPNQSDESTSDTNPFANYDPIVPSKNKNKKNDPDPDHFKPEYNDDSFF